MDNIFITDDDRYTPSNDQSSSDDISSVATGNLLPIDENDQQQISTSSMSSIHVSPVKVNNHSSPPNIEITLPYQSDDDENDQQQISTSSTSGIHVSPVKVNNHSSPPNIEITIPYQSDDDENNPFNDVKRIIIDEHVKVSRINHSSLRSINKDISLLRLNTCSSRKSTSHVSVFRTNKQNSQRINVNLNNRQITQMTPRQSTVRVNRISTAANINQGSDRKVIASKPMVTRVSLSKQRPFQTKQKELHVSVKLVSLVSNKSS